MIPFLNRLFANCVHPPKPTPPSILLGEGLRFTKTLDVPYRIAYVRNKSVRFDNIHGEIVVREPSGKEITGNLAI